MFDYAHYVPVLRWKRGERGALKWLEPADKAAMTPLLELLPGYMRPRRGKGGGPAGDDLSVVVEQIVDCWGSTPIFIDVAMVRSVPYLGANSHAVEHFFEALAFAGVQAIPVTRPAQAPSFQSSIREAARTAGHGVALRVPLVSLRTPSGGRELRELVAHLGMEPGSLHVIVEYGLVSEEGPSFSYICHRLPDLRGWRTFTVLAGSFPPDLMGFRVGEHEVQREEWKRWAAEIASSSGLPRRPSFGDYTIQHAIYHEPVKGANPSASIRYTSHTYWVIMRGEGLRNPGGAGHAQYRGNAQLLCERKEFCGAQFSAGDEYIYQIVSHQAGGPGTPETWLRAGINHHLTFAARQIPTVVVANT